MRKILLAFQFLTIIPIKGMKDVSEKEIGGTTAFFPLVGFVQGLLFAVSAILFSKFLPAELVNGLLILVIVVTNGGLHLDGLADTFDAVASRGNREKKLAIMRDSAVGPIGVIAIVIVILLKYLFLNAILSASLITYYSSLFLMPVFSRWVMVPAIFHGKSARQDGLGKIFVENTGSKELATSTFLTLLFIMLVVFINNKIIYSNPYFSVSVLLFFSILPVLYIFGPIVALFSKKRFGGMTGDTFGAVSEISEILFLLLVLILKDYLS